MTKSKLVKIIFDKCKNKKGLTKRQGEIVECFEGLAGLRFKTPYRKSDICFEEHEPTWEKALLQEIKGFIYNCDYSHLEEIFKGV